ncbi:Na+:H+ antiporter, NhaC family [Glaciecola punicea ACAM 611]|uniref:Na+:H+ antiporter, NhaC family n=1 Tax=Glaciecola punicea ACAM 611 TaxID=1121923 RepID=H5TE69_9ALTE|nr:Na+/H+ antiporter NhaC [Glaciecola punicea]GAB56596.1 Na+:H+ antiporter, NhaC family [Glaciecola punicea ACAM 611]
MKKTDYETPSFALALTPIVLTLFILGTQIFYFGVFEPHIPLAIGLAITSIVGIKLGLQWDDIKKGIFHVIHVALPSVSVLIIVGMIIGVWIASGTVPSIIYYGLKILSPEIFLPSAMVICALISVSLGTSWGSIGTVGLALMGIGEGFDIPMYWTAGAVVSGAFFGDKISPLSDTTNLAPAVTGTDVFSHIKNMMPTTIPAMLIALVIYLLVGFFVIDTQSVSFGQVEGITSALNENFYISGWVLLPTVVVMGLAIKQYPPIPSLFAGVVVGGATAMILQGQSLQSIFDYANNGYSISTGIQEIDSLLNRGGIQSMMWTISLILIALGYGGALEKTGCLKSIINKIKSKVTSFAGIQTAAVGTAFATNIVAGDPYLSVALPGRMYSPVYRGMGYSTLNLSRAIEEGGTLMSPLIPWNAGGAFVISTLGLGIVDGNLENLLYIPLAFACWTAPLIGIFYAFTGLFSPKATDKEKERWASSNEAVSEFNDDGTPKINDAPVER